MTPPPHALHTSSAPPERPFYLKDQANASFAVWHPPVTASGVGILLCPPFGWEEVSSYRPRRAWAQTLAAAGHGTVRLTLPSTGDSGGSPRDPCRVDAWTQAIAVAAEWLRTQEGVRHVVAIGMGLGGILAYRAAALGASIDDLVLWSVVSRGRNIVRQLKALERMESAHFFDGLVQPPPPPEGELEAGGFIMSAETVHELEALDLTTFSLPRAPERRVLSIGRDGPPEARLAEHLVGMGVQLSTSPVVGYEDMTSHPQTAPAPSEVFATVAEWLEPIARLAAASAAVAPAMDAALSLDVLEATDGSWVETPLAIPHARGQMAAILTSPAQPTPSGVCAVLLNTGAVRRTGPSRLWVEVARRWALEGVPSLRLDLPGIGDAEGPVVAYPEDSLFHDDGLLDAVAAALDAMTERGTDRRFLLLGLCSGAYWAFRTAIDDARVSGVVLINQRVVAWDEGLAPSRYVRRLLTERLSWSRIRRVVTVPLAMTVMRWLLTSPMRWVRKARRRSPASRDFEQLLERLAMSQTRTTYLFAHREPLYDELLRAGWLERLRQTGRFTVERVAVADHTLRPLWAQSQLHAGLDRALARELASGSGERPAAVARQV
jgi:alpha-beta hydrolase superfamily lysophospholipase